MYIAPQYTVQWSDLDINRHLGNSLYLRYITDARIHYFDKHGITIDLMVKNEIGPVVFTELTKYHKEMLFGESFTVHTYCSGLSEDGSRYKLLQQMKKQNGVIAAEVFFDGAWLSHHTRKLTLPIPEIYKMMQEMKRTEDFEVMKGVNFKK